MKHFSPAVETVFGRDVAPGGRKPAAPAKAQPAALSAAMSVNDAFKVVIRAGLAHLHANEHGMLASADPEYLHQMRVALRRLRSALDVFAPFLPETAAARLVAELKWLASSLGPARDWDVFVTETLPSIRTDSGRHAAIAAFGGQCIRLRRAARRKAQRAVASQRYRRFSCSLAGRFTAQVRLVQLDEAKRAALAAPARKFASLVLEERYDRVCKRGHRLAQLSSAELHRLRIAVKKFRYAADFFAGLYDTKAVRETLKRLSRLQNILGAMNDAATAANLMAHGFDGAPDRCTLEAKGILLGWSRGREATLRRGLKSAWKAFGAAGRFWQ